MERFLPGRAGNDHDEEKEAVMPAKTAVPKITVTLRTDCVEAEAPMLRFVRWKLVPLQAEVVEPDVREDEGHDEPSKKRTP